jgi:hypothetical protein
MEMFCKIKIKPGIQTVAMFVLLISGMRVSAHVALDYPEGGEIFSPGEVIQIKWHILIEHEQNNWDLAYSTDGGANWVPIVTDIPVSQLEYDWTLPDQVSEHAQVKVIQDNVGTDYEAVSPEFSIQKLTALNDFGSENEPPVSSIHWFATNGSIQINFTLTKEDYLSIDLFDLTGRLSNTLINARLIPGNYSEVLDKPIGTTGNLFIYRIKAGSFTNSGLISFWQ